MYTNHVPHKKDHRVLQWIPRALQEWMLLSNFGKQNSHKIRDQERVQLYPAYSVQNSWHSVSARTKPDWQYPSAATAAHLENVVALCGPSKFAKRSSIFCRRLKKIERLHYPSRAGLNSKQLRSVSISESIFNRRYTISWTRKHWKRSSTTDRRIWQGFLMFGLAAARPVRIYMPGASSKP